MGLFAFKLERADGTPADPPTLKTAVPTWGPGDTIPQDAVRRRRACGRACLDVALHTKGDRADRPSPETRLCS